MKIIFYADNIPFTLEALESYGLGGSESALINLASEFSLLGHEVVVYHLVTESSVYKGIISHPLDSPYIDLECDLFISLRSADAFASLDLSKARKKIFWCQDTRYHPSVEHLFANTKNILSNIDHIVILSKYVEKQFKQEGIEEINKKLVLIQNGYQHRFLINPVKSDHVEFVYCSTPFRGLQYLVDMWPRISIGYPNTKLNLFTGMQLYGQSQDHEHAWIYNRAHRYNNIILHGPVNQKELSYRLSGMDIMLYPNDYPESGCMALKEAMANSCTAVVSDLGALSEKILNGINGYSILGHPADYDYQDEFVARARYFLDPDNKKTLRKFQNKCRDHVSTWTWKNRSKEWLSLVDNLSFVELDVEL